MSFSFISRFLSGLTLGLLCVFGAQSLNAAQVTLTWDASTDQGVTGYKLYYGTASKKYTNAIDARNATSCLVPELQNGTTYYFAATAYNADRMESGFSNEVTYTTPAGETSTPPPTCTYSLSSSSASFSASGGSGSVAVTAPSGCAWSSSNALSWITVKTGSSGSGNGTFSYTVGANTTTSSKTAALTIAGKVYTVTQAAAEVAAPQTFTITVSATAGGSITPSGTVSVAQGGAKSFAIQSSSGYYLSDVKVNRISQGRVTSYTFTNVTANQTISATFGRFSYVLSVTKNGTGSGTITNNPSASLYPWGTTVTLTAAPSSGSQFAGWVGACSGTSPTCTVTMTSPKSVTATFNMR